MKKSLWMSATSLVAVHAEFKLKTMRVISGEVTKNIPAEYEAGFEMMLPEDWVAPKKVRLTPWERFRLALYTWESKQTSTTLRYLAGSSPECVVRQYNRMNDTRLVVRYVDEPDSDNVKHAIVPEVVGRLCPTIVEDYVNWQ